MRHGRTHLTRAGAVGNQLINLLFRESNLKDQGTFNVDKSVALQTHPGHKVGVVHAAVAAFISGVVVMRVVVINDDGCCSIFILGVEGDTFHTLRAALRLSQADCTELTVEFHTSSTIGSSCRRWQCCQCLGEEYRCDGGASLSGDHLATFCLPFCLQIPF